MEQNKCKHEFNYCWRRIIKQFKSEEIGDFGDDIGMRTCVFCKFCLKIEIFDSYFPEDGKKD